MILASIQSRLKTVLGGALGKKKKQKKSLFGKIFAAIFFILYILVLTDLLLFSFRTPTTLQNTQSFSELLNSRVNLTLFNTIKLYLRSANAASVVNILGNILAFAPMGFFIGFLFKKMRDVFFCTIIVAMTSLVYEAFQILLLVGRFDVDDILLNTIGGILGFCFHRLVRRRQ